MYQDEIRKEPMTKEEKKGLELFLWSESQGRWELECHKCGIMAT